MRGNVPNSGAAYLILSGINCFQETILFVHHSILSKKFGEGLRLLGAVLAHVKVL
jgi:hypothetical protein